MNCDEQLQHETIKQLLKQSIQNNPQLTALQKQIAMDNIDRAAQQADWIVEMLRKSGYLS